MSNKKYVFLFPGQGAQYPSMGMDFFDAFDEVKTLFAQASEITGRDMRKLIAEADGETLKRGETAQPAITLVNLSASIALKSRGIVPSACAGHSLGEYAALALCGVISAEDSLRLTAKRGELMQKAAEALGEAGGGMAAVIGLSPAAVEKAVDEFAKSGRQDLYIANLNSPRQTVVSGSAAALNEGEAWLKEAGARRFIRLAVAGPFHCPLMAAAADKFAAVLDSVDFHDPTVQFFSNVTGAQVKSGAEAKTLALRQICGAVRWTDEEAAIAAAMPNVSAPLQMALEAGPGKTLTGLWKDSGIPIPCFPAGTLADIDNIEG